MSNRVVILGSGSSGTLVANGLRRHYGDGQVDGDARIVVIDRIDERDQEFELLTALGLFGSHALYPPDGLGLRDGINFRQAQVATVDLDRNAVCLADGTSVGYDALVVATGTPARPAGASYIRSSPGLGDRLGCVAVDPRTLRSRARANVFALGGAAGPGAGRGRSVVAHGEAEIVVGNVLRFLAGEPLASYERQAVPRPEARVEARVEVSARVAAEPLRARRRAVRWLYRHATLRGRALPVGAGPR